MSILIYDMMGRQIRTLVNRNVSAGYHFINGMVPTNPALQYQQVYIFIFCRVRTIGVLKDDLVKIRCSSF